MVNEEEAREGGTIRQAPSPTPPGPPRDSRARDESELVLASPATRKLAREMGIDLFEVEGTGPRGRITREDVESASQRASRPRPAPSASASASASAPHGEGLAAKIAPSAPVLALPHRSEIAGDRTEERQPVRGLRKKIAERMIQSKHEAAHFAYVDELDATELVALRKRLKPMAERYGVSLTYLPFIVKALVPCLREFPLLNSSYDKEAGELVLKKYYNIGIAADTERGLTVPVVKDVDRKSVLEIAAEMAELTERARSNRSRLEDLQEGTFTITSTGNIGGLFATPIINYPEVAILGVPKIKQRPWVVDGKIEIREVLYLALSLDHRVVDGAMGARFMNRLIEYLTEPSRIFLELA
jgi:pyruvate dehydrogenase E2 component (dihydrolipoamide acetyltransferase)